jgi:hypothetical protein
MNNDRPQRPQRVLALQMIRGELYEGIADTFVQMFARCLSGVIIFDAAQALHLTPGGGI